MSAGDSWRQYVEQLLGDDGSMSNEHVAAHRRLAFGLGQFSATLIDSDDADDQRLGLLVGLCGSAMVVNAVTLLEVRALREELAAMHRELADLESCDEP